ncbi:MAG: hypothetical protein HY609_00460 [Deltaproteobacteria bacterium]|nr:hypothetical protein [Deltaproteobacteria bacterium]
MDYVIFPGDGSPPQPRYVPPWVKVHPDMKPFVTREQPAAEAPKAAKPELARPKAGKAGTPQAPEPKPAPVRVPAHARTLESFFPSRETMRTFAEKAAKIAIVAGGCALVAVTLAEDVVTLGAGIANDGPTVAAGLAMVRAGLR